MDMSCMEGKKMGPAGKQAAIASLKELIALMQGKMAEGDGETEMSGDSLSEAIEEATEGKGRESAEAPEMEASEDSDMMKEDMKNMLSGRKKPPSRAKLSITAMQFKKPMKKLGKA